VYAYNTGAVEVEGDRFERHIRPDTFKHSYLPYSILDIVLAAGRVEHNRYCHSIASS
jgi:hypothetical protein